MVRNRSKLDVCGLIVSVAAFDISLMLVQEKMARAEKRCIDERVYAWAMT
jgi:hypothetical protein